MVTIIAEPINIGETDASLVEPHQVACFLYGDGGALMTTALPDARVAGAGDTESSAGAAAAAAHNSRDRAGAPAPAAMPPLDQVHLARKGDFQGGRDD